MTAAAKARMRQALPRSGLAHARRLHRLAFISKET